MLGVSQRTSIRLLRVVNFPVANGLWYFLRVEADESRAVKVASNILRIKWAFDPEPNQTNLDNP